MERFRLLRTSVFPQLAPASDASQPPSVVTVPASTSTPGLTPAVGTWQGARQNVVAPPKIQTLKAHVLQTAKQDVKVQAQVQVPVEPQLQTYPAPAKGLVVGKVPGVAHQHQPAVASKVKTSSPGHCFSSQNLAEILKCLQLYGCAPVPGKVRPSG